MRLCGILSHCAKVVRGGRTFSRRVIDLLKSLPEGNPRIRLSDGFKKDLEWRTELAQTFNGKERVIFNSPGSSLLLYTDSCLKGYGILTGNDGQAGYFCSDVLPQGLEELCDDHGHWENVDVPDQSNINFLELVPIRLALERHSESRSNRHVIVFTDNTQVLCMINKGVSANSDCMDYICC